MRAASRRHETARYKVNNRSLLLKASATSAVIFLLLCGRYFLGHREFASQRFRMFAVMVFFVCLLSPFIVAFLGRHRQTEWPWWYLATVTAMTSAALGGILLASVLLLH